jgi:hypothetical protein
VTAPAAPRTIPVTSGIDGRCHLVTDDAYTAGLAARSGRYITLCGHRVVAAALVSPPGPDCQGCAAAATVAVTPTPPDGDDIDAVPRSGRHRDGAR